MLHNNGWRRHPPGKEQVTMWQNFITGLARNPLALKALAEVVAPTLRNLLRQETSEDVVALRGEVEALRNLASRDIPVALTGLGARQHEVAQSVELLRQEVQALGRRQSEREAALAAEVARLGEELAATQEALRKAQAAGTIAAPKRRLPW
jgi:hypothetical protein